MWTYLLWALFLLPLLGRANTERLLYQTQVKRLSAGKAEITLKPNWLGRRLMRRVRVGLAKRSKVSRRRDAWGWFWEGDGSHVGEHIEGYINCAPLLALEDIPIERLLEPSKDE